MLGRAINILSRLRSEIGRLLRFVPVPITGDPAVGRPVLSSKRLALSVEFPSHLQLVFQLVKLAVNGETPVQLKQLFDPPHEYVL